MCGREILNPKLLLSHLDQALVPVPMAKPVRRSAFAETNFGIWDRLNVTPSARRGERREETVVESAKE